MNSQRLNEISCEKILYFLDRVEKLVVFYGNTNKILFLYENVWNWTSDPSRGG
jgi:hypothetical protein